MPDPASEQRRTDPGYPQIKRRHDPGLSEPNHILERTIRCYSVSAPRMYWSGIGFQITS